MERGQRRECAGGQSTNHQYAKALRPGAIYDHPVVRTSESDRDMHSRAGIQKIEVGLDRLQSAALHQRVESRDFPNGSKANVLNLPLLAQALERLDHASCSKQLVHPQDIMVPPTQ